MTAEDLKAWRKLYFLTHAQLADILGVHVTTVARWEDGRTPPPKWLPIALESISGQRTVLAKKLRDRGVTLRERRRAARQAAS
jgi:DNA-binding XRE family transcriptional regulator